VAGIFGSFFDEAFKKLKDRVEKDGIWKGAGPLSVFSLRYQARSGEDLTALRNENYNSGAARGRARRSRFQAAGACDTATVQERIRGRTRSTQAPPWRTWAPSSRHRAVFSNTCAECSPLPRTRTNLEKTVTHTCRGEGRMEQDGTKR